MRTATRIISQFILQKTSFGVEYPSHSYKIRRRELANTKSALKEIRKNERRRQRNRLVRTSTRTAVKHAVRAVQSGATDAAQTISEAASALDKAATKGVIHRNAAARRKSRLAKKLKSRAPQA